MAKNPYRLTLDVNRETFLKIKTKALHDNMSAASLIRGLLKQADLIVEDTNEISDRNQSEQSE